MIAFDRDRGGNWDIYVKAAAYGAHAFRVTTNPAADFAPSFSPGGTRIAFTSDRGGNYDIYTIGTNGRQLRRITSSVAQDAFPSWSPNGRRIAFASNRGGDWEIYTVARQRLRASPGRSRTIWGSTACPCGRRTAAGSRLTPRATATTRSASSPPPAAPSPSSRPMRSGTSSRRGRPTASQIAFTSNRAGSFDVWVLTLASGALRQLTTDSDAEFQPAWSPDGSRDPVRPGHGRRADDRRDARKRRADDGADRPARE